MKGKKSNKSKKLSKKKLSSAEAIARTLAPKQPKPEILMSRKDKTPTEYNCLINKFGRNATSPMPWRVLNRK